MHNRTFKYSGLILALQLTLSGISLGAPEGPGSTGGGSSIRVEGRAVMADLHKFNPNSAAVDLEPGTTLPVTRSLKRTGIEKFADERINNFLQSKLSEWRANSPHLVPLIEQSLNGVALYYTDRQIALPSQEKAQHPSARLVAYYEAGVGAIISKQDFEEMSLTNQAALILHEVIRNVQIRYGGEFSERSLAALTAEIILSTPREGRSLESNDFLDGKLYTQISALSGNDMREAEAACVEKLESLKKNHAKIIGNLPVKTKSGRCNVDEFMKELGDDDKRHAYCDSKVTDPISREEWRTCSRSVHDAIQDIYSLGLRIFIAELSRNTFGYQQPVGMVKDITAGLVTSGLDEAIKEANKSFFYDAEIVEILRSAVDALEKNGVLLRTTSPKQPQVIQAEHEFEASGAK